MPNISLALSPLFLQLEEYDVQGKIVVVIDVFRATTSICYGIANGATAIIPVAEVSTCLSYKSEGFLLAAERDGKIVAGFDMGNSPFCYEKEIVNGKTIVLTTTNGTKAIDLSRGASKIVIGAFINGKALSEWLKNQQEDVLIVCSGWKNSMNLEDTLFGGSLVHKLQETHVAIDDASLCALDMYRTARQNIPAYLEQATHNKRLVNMGLTLDIDFCLQEDLLDAVPILREDKLVLLQE